MPRLKPTKPSSNNLDPFESNSILNKIEQMQEKFSEVSADFAVLKADVIKLSQVNEELKEIIHNQNKVVVDLLSEVKVIIQTSICPGKILSKYSDLFPICSIAELDDIELEISEETKDAMVIFHMHKYNGGIRKIATLSKILVHGGLRKNLTEIFEISLLLQFNVDGKQGKKRFLDYPKLLDVIYSVIDSKESISKKEFLAQLRKSIRLEKNLHYKNESGKRSDKNNSFLGDD